MSLSPINDDTVHFEHVRNAATTKTIFPQISIKNSSFKLRQLPAYLRQWKFSLHQRKLKTRVCHMLQAHGATIVIQPATQAITRWIIFIILNTGNFFVCCYDRNCWRTEWTTTERKTQVEKRQKKIMNETFGEHSLLDYALSLNRSTAKIAGWAVEICTAWRWWKTNYLSWHLNVCNSFRASLSLSILYHDVDEKLNRWCSHHQ